MTAYDISCIIASEIALLSIISKGHGLDEYSGVNITRVRFEKALQELYNIVELIIGIGEYFRWKERFVLLDRLPDFILF